MKFIISLIIALSSVLSAKPEKITYLASDGLQVTADLYREHSDTETPMIILFHQARSSRGEYREIAPKLVAMGFNCLAVDQRSGKTNGVANETNKMAKAAGKPTNFLDALPDLEASIKQVNKSYATGPVIIWGSSYSSSLVLKMAGDQPDIASGVLAFSPGEYFSSEGRNYIKASAAKIKAPVFITSAKSESGSWKSIFDAIPADGKVSFLPKGKGKHGSSALNEDVKAHKEYWVAVESFLAQWKPSTTNAK